MDMAEKARDPARLDATRRLIVDRAAELGKSIAALNGVLPDLRGRKRNDKWLDDYLWKGSPWKLDDDERRALAAEIEVEDWQLLPVELGESAARFGDDQPAPAQHPAETAPMDAMELLGWLAEQLEALHETERLPLGLRELVTAAAEMHEEIGTPATTTEYHELAKRALDRRRLWLRRHRAAILTGRSQAGA